MMRASFAAALAAALILAGSGPARAQSAGVNPDISVIPQFIVCPQGVKDCPYADAKAALNLQEVELALQGYLNPYVRGDVFVGVNPDGVDVEEAYATFVRGLGPVQLKLGKYRVDWGNVNPLHPHAYSWIFAPLVEERFFGSEGLDQIAANVNASFPAGEQGELKVSGDLLRGDIDAGRAFGPTIPPPPSGAICVGPGCADGVCNPGDADCAIAYYQPPAAPPADSHPKLAGHLRVSYFDEIKPNHSLLVGVDGLTGTLDPSLDRKTTWLGANAKYRWRPSKYRSLNAFASYIHAKTDLAAASVRSSTCVGPDCVANVCPADGLCAMIDDVHAVKSGSASTSGWYAIADYQFALRWNGGLKFDSSQGLETTDTIRRAEAFVAFALMEETTLFRFLYRHETGDGYDRARNVTALQFLFSLGPHRPHAF